MNWKRYHLILLLPLVIISFPSTIFAAQAKIQGDYCYQYGDSESLMAAKEISYAMALRKAIETYKTFVASTSVVQDFKLRKDLVETIASGYVENVQIVKQDVKGRNVCTELVGYVNPDAVKSIIARKVERVQKTKRKRVEGLITDQPSSPPRCIGDVCLGDHIDKYRDRIDRGWIDYMFGPLLVLKDRGRYVSAKSDEKDKLNRVVLSFCHAPRTIKTIYRVIKDTDQYEYDSLQIAYRKKYGGGKPFEHSGGYEMWWRWEWEKPSVTLDLSQKKNSPYITITLHNQDLGRLDWECLDKKVLKEKQDEGLVPK